MRRNNSYNIREQMKHLDKFATSVSLIRQNVSMLLNLNKKNKDNYQVLKIFYNHWLMVGLVQFIDSSHPLELLKLRLIMMEKQKFK